MRRRLMLAALAGFVLPLRAEEMAAVESARRAALQWLALVDTSDAAGSWGQAASLFKRAITREQWGQALPAVRGPLGAVRQRQNASSEFKRSLPGAPDGQYVVLQFATRFEHKADATETVTTVFDGDGKWRVTGYFIR